MSWIKMRYSLLNSAKVNHLTRILNATKEFRDWFYCDDEAKERYQIVTNDGLRCVTTALLLRVWSLAREHGNFQNEDLILTHCDLEDIDGMAGVEGFAKAMAKVEWLIEDKENQRIIFPNFKQHNAPKDAAEKQKDYRKRQKETPKTVTDSLPNESNAKPKNVTSRGEERREEKNNKKETPLSPSQPSQSSKSQPFDARHVIPPHGPLLLAAWADWVAHRKQIKKPLTERAAWQQVELCKTWTESEAVQSIRQSIQCGWTGLFPAKPANTKPTTAPANGFKEHADRVRQGQTADPQLAAMLQAAEKEKASLTTGGFENGW